MKMSDYTSDAVLRADSIASMAHFGQLDKGGVPYYHHVHRVAEEQISNKRKIIAFLHDTLEDTKYTAADLREAGFSEEIIEAVELLTHKKGVPYMEYIEALSADIDCCYVKLADLADNIRIDRIPNPTQKDWERQKKYLAAQRYLSRKVSETLYLTPEQQKAVDVVYELLLSIERVTQNETTAGAVSQARLCLEELPSAGGFFSEICLTEEPETTKIPTYPVKIGE